MGAKLWQYGTLLYEARGLAREALSTIQQSKSPLREDTMKRIRSVSCPPTLHPNEWRGVSTAPVARQKLCRGSHSSL